MNTSDRLPAVLAYIPILGWLYVYLFQRKNTFAVFHLRQGVGLVLFLIGGLLVWAVVAWLVAWIPYMAVVSVALFALVIAVYIYGAVALVMGLLNALRNRLSPLPFFGRWANRLPIR